MDAITSNQAKLKLDELINKVSQDAQPTILCNDEGKQAVLMSLDEFNSWQETLYLLSNPANAAHIQTSIIQAKTGKKFIKNLIEQ